MNGLITARAFAPGSVGNIGVGFDLLGHTIDGVRDVAMVRRIDEPAVRIRAIRGDGTGVGHAAAGRRSATPPGRR